MINDVLKGIANALYTEFGENIEISYEDIEQGLDEVDSKPTFIIKCIDLDYNQDLDIRYKRNHLVSITFIPTINHKNEITEYLYGIIEKLQECLEYIDVQDGLMNGTNIKPTINEDVLVITVNYDDFAYKVEDKDMMENLEVKVNGN